MKCLYPHYRWVVDPFTLEKRRVTYPCGHCINCLRNQQDAWAIRVDEEAKHCEGHKFIYDTLTFAPENMPFVSVEHLNLLQVSPASRKLVERFSDEYARCTGEEAKVLPYVTRDVFRDWVRNARELYVYKTGVRPSWKYLAFMEYGPLTSRPHIHLLFFNISLNDYKEYLQSSWNERYGFNYLKEVCNEVSKDRQCVARYISKYCSKGCFESPLVSEGLVPRPFRSISHGLGAAYLESSRFDEFRKRSVACFKRYEAEPFFNERVGDFAGKDYSMFRIYDSFFGEIFDREAKPTDCALDFLVKYVDESSFVHALPRYYKNKLLNLHKPNYYASKVQSLLYARAEQRDKKLLFEFALQLGYHYARKEAPNFGFSDMQYDSLSRQYLLVEKDKARSQAQGNFVKLKNHYFRPMRNKAFAYVS